MSLLLYLGMIGALIAATVWIFCILTLRNMQQAQETTEETAPQPRLRIPRQQHEEELDELNRLLEEVITEAEAKKEAERQRERLEILLEE